LQRNILYIDTKRRYSIAAACFMIQAVGIGVFVTYGVFFNYLLAEFNWSRAVISGASSAAFFLSGVFAMAVGRLSDRFGPRILMSVASVSFGLGFMLMSQVTELWQLYFFYGVLFGIGLSSIDVIALTTTARWFVQSRGLMTGIVKVGTGAGQFSIPFLASILIGLYGWRQTYLIIGSAALVVLFVIAQFIQPRDDNGRCLAFVDSKDQSEIPTRESQGLNTAEALKTVQLWILCGANLLLVFSLLTVLVHIVPHAIDLGLSGPAAAGVLSTIGAVSMAGRFASGMAIDRIGSKAIMVICFFILIGALLWLQIADSQWMLYLFGAVYGLAHGGFFTAISPIVAEIFGIASHGAIFGIVVFSGTTGGSIGPIIAGQIFDVRGSYSMVFTMITLMGLVSFGLMLLLKPIVVRSAIGFER
jgi:MFS family permease